jgi:hypothetical protein
LGFAKPPDAMPLDMAWQTSSHLIQVNVQVSGSIPNGHRQAKCLASRSPISDSTVAAEWKAKIPNSSCAAATGGSMREISACVRDSLSSSIKMAQNYARQALGIEVCFVTSDAMKGPYLKAASELRPSMFLESADQTDQYRVSAQDGIIRLQYTQPYMLAFLVNCRKFIFRSIIQDISILRPEMDALCKAETGELHDIWRNDYELFAYNPDYLRIQISPGTDIQVDFGTLLIPANTFLLGHEIGHLLYRTLKAGVHRIEYPLTNASFIKLRDIVRQIVENLAQRPMAEDIREAWFEEIFCDLVAFQLSCREGHGFGRASNVDCAIFGSSVLFLFLALNARYTEVDTGLAVRGSHPTHIQRFESLLHFYDLVNTGQNEQGYRTTRLRTNLARDAVEHILKLTESTNS